MAPGGLLAAVVAKHCTGRIIGEVSADCPHIKGCAMYPLLTLSGSLKTWQVRYCEGNFSECERYKRTVQGRDVPAQLMPNGMLLRKGLGGAD